MASYWTKRRRVLAKAKEMENVILQEFNSTINRPENVPPSDEQSDSALCETALDAESMSWQHTGDNDIDNFNEQCSSDDNDLSVLSSDDDNDPKEISLKDKLKQWASTFGINLVAITALLSILSTYHPELPRDARTLLGTTRKTNVEALGGGQYHHFGLVKGILSRLNSIHLPSSIQTIRLKFNIDGLPIFKSSKVQFWPILAMVDCDYTKTPFIVGLFCGTGKPSNVHEYLKAFMEDLRQMLSNGVTFRGKSLKVMVCSFICDAPARAFVKQIKSHNGYSGCDKCHQVGVWRNKMTYPDMNARLRSDEDFALMSDTDHHLQSSPLTGIVQMVTQFPIDYMHLCCLGVTRKLIIFWMKSKNLAIRQPSNVITAISTKLIALRPHTPSEFARKPRELTEIDRWKATELRQFMIYSGPVVLKRCLPQDIFENFLLFSVGMFLLLSPNLSAPMIDFADTVLRGFVTHYAELYGQGEIVYNIHQVIHLADVYKKFGALDSVSAFPFENFLGKIKKMLRKPDLPLQQVVRRLSEVSDSYTPPPRVIPLLFEQHQDGPLPLQFCNAKQYRKAVRKDFCLSVKTGDNCIVVGQEIAVVQNIVEWSDSVFVVYKRFKYRESHFTYPCPSSNIGCFQVHTLGQELEVGHLEDIRRKCVLLPDQDHFVAIPLLHQS
ncbi:hypothetical protein ACEWY4_016796 [Coilia grayii]|uniref:Transposase domain-containing protein n=1 Tax=Coilia grayii TaxID=363190 RepID=A0ABD1JLF5_9TELE